ncbi:ATP-dependent DNA helicase-like protein II [Corynespora cassiicola Philippines]|uniref:ATP-dependent DNA helicase II subunit 2 n=1 Tax=Corynespora cassiicola Philippines TaxID=1448308 RepID=A0A2T2NRD0_CORCC|nr:ATP-dependent DNA helicase-like protein II [Corynespora cassiicola Philippines]
MAQKEATVYIVDLGRSMGERRHGRDKTNLEWALDYVWDKITTTVSTGRKTALMGVVGFRTDETDLNGVMQDDEGYSNISVFELPKQFLLSDIRNLSEKLKPSSTNTGDLMSAIAIAIQMIDMATNNKAGKPLKFDRRINIITDGQGYMDIQDLDDITGKLRSPDAPFEITLLGVDFDDPDSGYKEEDKDSQKAENEKILREWVESCDGNYGTLSEAIEQLAIPRIKSTKPVPSYRGMLTLGGLQDYDATISIDVERYPCTMIAKPPTSSSFVVRAEGAGVPTQSTTTVAAEDPSDEQLAAVRNQRIYQIDDPDNPGNKKDVEADELERGFEYGRTAVHISESDANVVKLETTQSLEIIGFIPEEKFERYLPMSRTNYIIAQRANQQSSLALSSFIHALYEAECYAVARFVVKDHKPPVIVLLVPRIEGDEESLIDVELPFEEDMRRYKFPSLDRRLTVSGKVVTEHKDLPKDDLMKAMSDYVDAMDLSEFGKDDDGEPTEYAKFQDTYSPLLHRINHVIRWRATHTDPSLPIPPPPAILTKYSAPPEELIASAQSQLDQLKKAADVKQVPPKQKGRGKRSAREHEKPLSGLDVDKLLNNGSKRIKVESSNLIPTFKQSLATSDELEAIQAAVDAMDAEIRNYISNSVGESGYGRALEAIRVVREEITELEEPDIYNNFIRKLKKDILEGKLNGERRAMWWKIRGSKYGLIDRKASMVSDVTESDADAFYKG